MSLDQLHDYVEKKLSKEHYSPEVIYLLFQIQSLLLEKENLNNNLSIHITTITELKKDLIAEKTLISDLKDGIRESTTELEEIEKETVQTQLNAKTEYTTLTQNYQIVIKRKNLYEKILMYLIPITMLELAIFITYVINICYYMFSGLFSLIKILDYQQIPVPQTRDLVFKLNCSIIKYPIITLKYTNIVSITITLMGLFSFVINLISRNFAIRNIRATTKAVK